MGTALDIKIKRANKVYRCGVSAAPGPARQPPQPPPLLRAPRVGFEAVRRGAGPPVLASGFPLGLARRCRERARLP